MNKREPLTVTRSNMRRILWRAPATALVGYWDQNGSMRCIPCALHDGGWAPHERVTALEAAEHRRAFYNWPCCKLCGAEFAPVQP